MITTPLQVLQKYWKHQSFREPQAQIIDSVLQGKDTFALLPTGAGKSICFQVPTLVKKGITLVVSPLIALIQDQVLNLTKKGIKATAIVGAMPIHEIDAVFDNCHFGQYKFIYISPEKLQQDWILERLQKLDIQLIAIDEAHCISQWGHDFRPAYLELGKLRDLFDKVPIIALTASANQRVIDDICTILKLDQPNIFRKSFLRENLFYGVYQVNDKIEILTKILNKNLAPTIVYAKTRKQTQIYAQALENLGFTASFFHGGLSSGVKKKRLNNWLEQKTLIMVATNAFGMGIDKENVKNVVHLQLPDNLENYYQEAGRAGRNNQKAFASILLNPQEIQNTIRGFEDTLFDKEFLKLIYRKLNNHLNIAYGEGFNVNYSFNFNAFCKKNNFPLTKAYNALQFLDRQGILKFVQDLAQNPKLQLTSSSSALLDHLENDPLQEQVLLHIIRNYIAVFEQPTEIDLLQICNEFELTVDTIMEFLQTWHNLELCTFIPKNNDISVIFNEPYEQERTLYRTFSFLTLYNQLKVNQFKAVVKYVENQDICKNKILLEYFDQQILADCQNCSSCINKNNNNNQ
ncbi:RecQ family ATP-dependent DNA helicase [Myroides sp. LJL110]